MLKYASLLLLIPLPAWAARPMVTDDARVVDPKACQLESWTRFNRRSTEYWALPGCNFGFDTEFTLGGARGDAEGRVHATDIAFQAKHLLRPLRTNGWGLAVAAGQIKHPRIDQGGNLLGDVFVNVPVSVALQGERQVLHLNGGWLHDKASGRERATWGVGAESGMGERGQLIAEAFGQSGAAPYYQAGIRLWVVPQRVQIDTTTGGQFGVGGEGRWLSVGLRLLSPAFLP